MIAIVKSSSPRSASPTWHQQFLAMLPRIRRHAVISFRQLDVEAREEAVQEVICNALTAYRRLVELGKADVAYPSALARYGVAQFRVGRRVGASLNVRDATSEYCRRRKGVQIENLDRFDRETMTWNEILVECRKAGPAETAASRIDFSAWLRSLSRRRRKIATLLAMGESTTAVARKFKVSLGRASQFRRELEATWEAFTSDRTMPATA
jgi:hypothetical protein